jgi:diguanylate cyclase (GGDEF)-like protein
MVEKLARILLVERDPGDAQALPETLANHGAGGVSISLACGFPETHAALAAHPPDIVVLYLKLLDKDGLLTAREMLRFVRGVPVVVVAESGDDELGLHAVQAGAQDCIFVDRTNPRNMPRMLQYAMARHQLKATAEAQSVTDELTHLSNRRGFLALARRHFELARRTSKSLVLVHANLEGLQEINDRLGHDQGNTALREAAAILRVSCRNTDVLGRFGGGEFAMLAIDTGPPGSAAVQSRIDKEIRMRNFTPGRRYRLSMTVGAQGWSKTDEASFDGLMARGESAMAQQRYSRQVVFDAETVPETEPVFPALSRASGR